MSGTKDTTQSDQPGAGANHEEQDTSVAAEGQETGSQDQGGDQLEDDSIYSDPKKAAEAIKALRAENAERRKKNKELSSRLNAMEQVIGKVRSAAGGDEEGEELSPEEAVEHLSMHSQGLELKNAILSMAIDSEIPKDRMEYFEFLMHKRLGSLEENEELTEEDISEVVQSAMLGVQPRKTSSGVSATNGNRPDPDAKSELSVDQFVAMNNGEKSALFNKNPDLYKKLFAQARDSKRL